MVLLDEVFHNIIGNLNNSEKSHNLDPNHTNDFYFLLSSAIQLLYGSENITMCFYQHRFATFTNDWPRDRPKPAEMALAGMYYTGTHDTVRCFACQRNLTEWQAHEVPFTEHCSLLPNCTFVKLVRYLRGQMGDMELISLAQIGEQKVRKLSQLSSEDQNRVFEFAVKLGHNKDLLVSLVARRLFSSESIDKVYEVPKLLIQDAFQAFDSLIDPERPTIIDGLHTVLANLPQTTGAASNNPSAAISPATSADPSNRQEGGVQPTVSEAQRLYEDNLRLISQRLCHMCYTRRSNHVILPCGHLALCEECIPSSESGTVSLCPVCDTRITRIIRVYQ